MINFAFIDNLDEAMSESYPSCNENFDDLFGYKNITACSCNSCKEACSAAKLDAKLLFFDGFNGLLVGLSYGAIVIITVVLIFIKRAYNKKLLDGVEEEETKEFKEVRKSTLLEENEENEEEENNN